MLCKDEKINKTQFQALRRTWRSIGNKKIWILKKKKKPYRTSIKEYNMVKYELMWCCDHWEETGSWSVWWTSHSFREQGALMLSWRMGGDVTGSSLRGHLGQDSDRSNSQEGRRPRACWRGSKQLHFLKAYPFPPLTNCKILGKGLNCSMTEFSHQ